MKIKISAVIAAVLLIGVVLGLIFWPRPILTKMPSGINEKPVLLYELTGGTKNHLLQPMGVTVSSEQRIYVADTGHHQIKLFDQNCKYIKAFGHQGTGPGELEYPYGIVAMPNSHILVADTINLNVQEFNQKGKYIKTWLDAKAGIKPGAMYIGSNGQLYIADLKNHQVVMVNRNGIIEQRISSKPEGLLYPQGLFVDKNELIWVADAGHNAIKQIDSNGIIKNIIWGVNESIPFSMVRGVAIDNLGRVFVSDPLNGSVTVFNEKRELLFPLNGQFSYPMGINISDDGRIYIIDRGNSVIKVWGYKK